MKKKFLRSCFALLLSMVLLFGGVRLDAAAIGDVSPFGPVLPPSAVIFNVSAPQAVIAKGETMQMSYSATPSGGSITWSSSNTSVATVNSSGLVTAVAVGNVTITGRYVYNGTAYTDSVSLVVANIPIGLRNNTDYYLVNYSSGRLMGVANTSDANLTNVQTVTPTSSAWYQWTIELQSDGRFQFINKGSPTDKCLDLSDLNIDIYTHADRDSTKFTIQRVTSGDQAGLYLIKYGNNFVVEKSDHNVAIQPWYSPGCYWSFSKVDKGTASFVGFHYTYKDAQNNTQVFNSSGRFDDFCDTWEDIGYDANQTVNSTSGSGYGLLRSSDIFTYAGHGESGRITFCITNDYIVGAILAHEDMDLNIVNSIYVNQFSYNELADAKCVLYMGCRAGLTYTNSNGSYNLVDETFNKGAHYVLGITTKIQSFQVNDWLGFFVQRLTGGYDIKECVDFANRESDVLQIPTGQYIYNEVTQTYEQIYNPHNGLPIHDIGDDTQYLNLQ